MSCESIFSCVPARDPFSLRRASICAIAWGLISSCIPAAPAPEILFDNSHPARLNPATEKIISVEVNKRRIIRRRFKCFCVVEGAGLDTKFLFTLNLIVGRSFGVETYGSVAHNRAQLHRRFVWEFALIRHRAGRLRGSADQYNFRFT